MRSPIFKLTALAAMFFTGLAGAETVATQHLPTVEVKARAVSPTNRITLKQMDETTDTELKEVLKNEPSISFGGGAGQSSFMYIRGMGQNSIDVKLDNAYSDSQIHYHQSRHMLDPALVKIVAVQKGAGSASAGIGQTNGAIVAKTIDAADLLKNSSNPNFGAKINLGYNSNDGHNYGLALFGQSGAFDFLLAGNRVNDNEYKGGKGYYNSYRKNDRVNYSELDKISYLAKIGANLGDNRITLSHLHEQQKGRRLVREEFMVDPDNIRLTEERQFPAERKMYVTNTNLEWTGKNLGFAKSGTANVYRMIYGRWSGDDSGNGYAGGKRNTGPTTTRVQTIGANVNFDSQVHDKVLLKYGVNYRNQEIKPHKLFNANLINQEKQDAGIYAEAIADVTDKLTLTGGLRYDYFNFKAMDGKRRHDSALNPSVSAIFQATPELSFRAQHNYATRSPRLHDALLSHTNVTTIASDTKAERARNTEIGFSFQKNGFGLDGTYFWQNIKDALGTNDGRDNHACMNVPKCGTKVIINAGKIKNKGYELNSYYRWNGLTARLGVAHAKPRFLQFYGKQLSENPEYATVIGRTWTAALSYQFANPNLEIGIQHRQVEKVKAADNYLVANSTVKRAPKGKAGYGVTDISANWKPLNNDKLNVNLAVDNVTNKLYYPHSQRGPFPGEGRQYRVGVNYTF